MIGLISGNQYSQLSKLLEKRRLLSKKDFKEAMSKAEQDGRYVTQVLLENESLQQDDLLKTIAECFGIADIRLRNVVVSPLVLNLIPREIAEQHSVIVFKKIKNSIHVATAAPENLQTIDFIKQKTGFEPQVFLTTPQDIRHALRKYKSDLSDEFDFIIRQSTQEALDQNETPEKMAHFVPIIKMVDTVIERAILQRASDIHVEPMAAKICIRFRIDGMLHTVSELPRDILPPIVARIKLMASLKLDEHRRPQDSRYKFTHDTRDIAIRVSSIPTLHGTKIVLRLLDAQEKPFGFRRLGFNKLDLATLMGELQKPHGMVLVTGPTGSGKTTTLYTLLRKLNRDDINICTVEDPIEYGLEGINQMQVNPDGGVTFATGLRSLLRQDPNVIMVGEIRDVDTADIAVNAAMTGHLVLSTLHTNNAFMTPQRLIEMGVHPYLVSTVTNLIVAQRLVRRVCPECHSYSSSASKIFDRYRAFFDIDEALNKFQRLGLISKDLTLADLKYSYGNGCTKCADTGYQGRIGIYELLKIDDAIWHLILKNAPADVIRAEATKRGTLTMKEDGLLKVFLGQTTLDELCRVT